MVEKIELHGGEQSSWHSSGIGCIKVATYGRDCSSDDINMRQAEDYNGVLSFKRLLRRARRPK
jgi:hypothetical protein